MVEVNCSVSRNGHTNFFCTVHNLEAAETRRTCCSVLVSRLMPVYALAFTSYRGEQSHKGFQLDTQKTKSVEWASFA